MPVVRENSIISFGYFLSESHHKITDDDNKPTICTYPPSKSG